MAKGEVKVESKIEEDGDYGQCLRVYINDMPTDCFVQAREGAGVEVFRVMVAQQYFEIERLKEEANELHEFKDTFRKLLRMCGMLRISNGKMRI
jgi:hypothetical protein